MALQVNQQGMVYYTVQWPYALVLMQRTSRPERYQGYHDTDELHEHMRRLFGINAVQLSSLQFQLEVERRQVHTPEVIVLLMKNGELLGLDLSRHLVYGSPMRPMDSVWARISGAVYMQSDKYQTGYHTYVAVPQLLTEEVISKYHLEIVSRPEL